MQKIIPIINLPKEEIEMLMLHCPQTLAQLRLRDNMINALETETRMQREEIKRWEDATRRE